MPLDAAYAAPAEFYFKPRDARFKQSQTVFKWREQNKRGTVLTCVPNLEGLEAVYFRVRFKFDLELSNFVWLLKLANRLHFLLLSIHNHYGAHAFTVYTGLTLWVNQNDINLFSRMFDIL